MSSPNSILHSVGGNLARPTHFDIIVTIPSKISQGKLSPESWNVLAKTITIPTLKMEPLEYKHKGHSIPIPGVSQLEHTLPISFILDENFDFNKSLYYWLDGIDSNFTSPSKEGDKIRNNPDLFKGEIKVIGYNWEKIPVVAYGFSNVFPISVSGPEFVTDSVSAVMDINVDFAFSNMYVEKISREEGILEGAAEMIIDRITGKINEQKERIISGIKNNTSIVDIIGNGIKETNNFFKSL